MLKQGIVFGAAFAAAGLAGSASAITVVQYDTAAAEDNATIAASSVVAGVTADALATGGGLTANSGSTWNWRGWNDDAPTTSYADAVADGDTWTWGFDVTGAGVEVDLTSFDIRVDRSGTGPNQFEIQVSVNGGTPVSVLTHDFGDSGSGVDFAAVDLSALPTLFTGDSIVFTFAAFGHDSGGGSSAGTFDLESLDFGGSDQRSIRIEGTVIPEPASLALLGLGGLCLLGSRRRKA